MKVAAVLLILRLDCAWFTSWDRSIIASATFCKQLPASADVTMYAEGMALQLLVEVSDALLARLHLNILGEALPVPPNLLELNGRQLRQWTVPQPHSHNTEFQQGGICSR